MLPTCETPLCRAADAGVGAAGRPEGEEAPNSWGAASACGARIVEEELLAEGGGAEIAFYRYDIVFVGAPDDLQKKARARPSAPSNSARRGGGGRTTAAVLDDPTMRKRPKKKGGSPAGRRVSDGGGDERHCERAPRANAASRGGRRARLRRTHCNAGSTDACSTRWRSRCGEPPPRRRVPRGGLAVPAAAMISPAPRSLRSSPARPRWAATPRRSGSGWRTQRPTCSCASAWRASRQGGERPEARSHANGSQGWRRTTPLQTLLAQSTPPSSARAARRAVRLGRPAAARARARRARCACRASLPAPAAAESGAPPRRAAPPAPEHTWALDALFAAFPASRSRPPPSSASASYSTRSAARGFARPRRAASDPQPAKLRDGVRRHRRTRRPRRSSTSVMRRCGVDPALSARLVGGAAAEGRRGASRDRRRRARRAPAPAASTCR